MKSTIQQITIITLIISFFWSCFNARTSVYNHSELNEYKVNQIDSTNNYYILKSLDRSNKNVTLVIEKQSKQLCNLNLTTGKKFKFSTYGLFDLVHLGNYEHLVEGKKVWSSEENVDLRFTNSMGNENDTIINGRIVLNGKRNKIKFGLE